MRSEVVELSNGIRVVIAPKKGSSVIQCGYVINAGTRDESADKNGLAHFFEHLIFKGTHKRKAWHILNYVDRVGGEINAFTTREKTCYHVTITKNYLARAIDLLSDITFRSVFPAKEIEKEKIVVADEMDMYKDNPEESIFDDFEELVFPNHGLGKPILGTRESIQQFCAQDLIQFQKDHYTQNNIVFSIAGQVSTKKVVQLLEKNISMVQMEKESQERIAFQDYKPQYQHIKKNITQNHIITGGRAFPLRQHLFLPFLLLNHYLGGDSMNARLNMIIREKYGLSYSISSFYNAYSDDGIWGIYAGCEPGNRKKLMLLIEKELKRICEFGISPPLLERIKKQYIGNMLIGLESLYVQMLVNAKNVLDFGKPDQLKDLIQMIQAITADQMLEAAIYCFNPEQMTTLIYEPELT